MPAFVLNTSGTVAATDGLASVAPSFDWESLDSFTQGYIEALFFTDEEQLCEESEDGHEMPDVAFNMATMESHFVGGNSYGFADLAPDTLASIIEDCATFQQNNSELLALAYARDDYNEERAGHDFWFTRNGHGVGYWDRKELEDNSEEYEALTAVMVESGKDSAAWFAAVTKRRALSENSLGEKLSKAARKSGGRDSYVGDDGKVHLS